MATDVRIVDRAHCEKNAAHKEMLAKSSRLLLLFLQVGLHRAAAR